MLRRGQTMKDGVVQLSISLCLEVLIHHGVKAAARQVKTEEVQLGVNDILAGIVLAIPEGLLLVMQLTKGLVDLITDCDLMIFAIVVSLSCYAFGLNAVKTE